MSTRPEIPAAIIALCGGEVLAQLLWQRGVREADTVSAYLGSARYWGTPPQPLLFSAEEPIADVFAEVLPELYIDLAEVGSQLLKGLYRLVPFAADRPEPVFGCRSVQLVTARGEGLSKRHARFIIEDDEGHQLRGMWWHMDPRRVPKGRGQVVFRLRVDDRLGREEILAEVFAFCSQVDSALKSLGEHVPVEDLRQIADAPDRLACLQQVQIWAEGSAAGEVAAGLRRDQLSSGGELAVWTRPPAPEVFRAVVQRVQPVRLWLFAAPFSVPSRGRFLRDLAALAKAVIAQRAGRINREELFGRLGQTEAVVLAGLGALSARGMLRVRCVEQRVLLEEGSGQGEQDLGGDSLSALLEDVAAYRRYMQSAPVGELLGVDPH